MFSRGNVKSLHEFQKVKMGRLTLPTPTYRRRVVCLLDGFFACGMWLSSLNQPFGPDLSLGPARLSRVWTGPPVFGAPMKAPKRGRFLGRLDDSKKRERPGFVGKNP